MVALAALFLSACIGSGGSSAPAPINVHVVAKDSRAIVTWDVVPGVEYWIFRANGTGVTPQNCSSMPSCFTAVNVTSPASIPNLINGYPYSFSINGRIDGGPGGPGSVAVDAIPRLAGATWTATAPLKNPIPSTTVMRGVAYGVTSTAVATFVAAGDSSALYSGTVYTSPNSDPAIGVDTGISWTPQTTNPLPSTTFNAVSYDAYGTKYFVAGNSGAILQSTDAVTWTPQDSSTTKTGSALYAIANNGGNTIVATGAVGTITTSLDGGTSWNLATSIAPGTSANLNGVAYGNSIFVAVGAGGTLLYSVDGDAWTNVTSASIISTDLKGVTYGLVGSVGTFVAVSADGKVITSTNGRDWTAPVSVSSTLNAVTASANAVVPLLTTITTAFVAVDNAGNIFRSTDGGVTWPQVNTGSGPLYAITRGGLYDYFAVGSAGLNLYAD